jgi:hypothetical protein
VRVPQHNARQPRRETQTLKTFGAFVPKPVSNPSNNAFLISDRAGATIGRVTHDPRYARHAERNIHLSDGRVVEPLGMAAS